MPSITFHRNASRKPIPIIFSRNSLIFGLGRHTFSAVSEKLMGVSKSTSVDSNNQWRHCEKLNLMLVDTALGRMFDSHITTTEPSCAAITAYASEVTWKSCTPMWSWVPGKLSTNCYLVFAANRILNNNNKKHFLDASTVSELLWVVLSFTYYPYQEIRGSRL